MDQKFRKQSGFPKRQLFLLSLREEKIVVYRALETDFGFFLIAFSFCRVFQKSYCNKHINVKIYLNAPADKNNSGFHEQKWRRIVFNGADTRLCRVIEFALFSASKARENEIFLNVKLTFHSLRKSTE